MQKIYEQEYKKMLTPFGSYTINLNVHKTCWENFFFIFLEILWGILFKPSIYKCVKNRKQTLRQPVFKNFGSKQKSENNIPEKLDDTNESDTKILY